MANDYRKVLDCFHEQREYMERRIAAGIEQHRKGDFALRFKDAAGNPVPGAKVKASLRRHAFDFGANLFLLDEFPSAEQNAEYRRAFAQVCNLATLPFYWRDLEPVQGQPRFAKDSKKIYRRPAPDLCLEYCEEKGIKPKAHCLNYQSFTPDWAKGGIAYEKEMLMRRFRELAERYAGRIPDWEVTNETFWEWDPMQSGTSGNFYRQPDLVEWSFRAADHFFPGNRLIINEEQRWVWANDGYHGNRSAYFMQIQRALAAGARIDAIGFQAHQFWDKKDAPARVREYYSPRRMFAVLDTYAQLGRKLQVTEMTIPSYSWDAADEEVQAEELHCLYGILFSHPAVEGVIYWNLVDGFTYGKQGDMTDGENVFHGGLLRKDFTPKKAYLALDELVHRTWHTEAEFDVGNGGEAAFRGFYGTYDLEITVGGRARRVERAFLPEAAPTHTIVLPD